jgi:hypothetical protein
MSTRTDATRTWWLASIALAAVALSACSKPPDGTSRLTTMATQTLSITVSGTVADTAGDAIADAAVFGSSAATGTLQSVTVRTDASGRFNLGAFDVTPTDGLYVVTSKPGYGTDSRRLLPTAASVDLNMMLVVHRPLSVDQTVQGRMNPASPGGNVGDPYESDYTWNMHAYDYSVPSTADCIVELEWDRVGNATLMMWAQSGAIVSLASGTKQVLRLPRGTSGTLIVGQAYASGRLQQPVNYTLTTRAATD